MELYLILFFLFCDRCRALQYLNMNVGTYCAEGLKLMDNDRIKKANRAVEEIQRKARVSKRNAKRRLEEDLENAEAGPSYAAGEY